MDRTACVDIPALPLQLLLRAHPEWMAAARGACAAVAGESSEAPIGGRSGERSGGEPRCPSGTGPGTRPGESPRAGASESAPGPATEADAVSAPTSELPPVAVVDEDRPQGVVLWIGEAAFRRGVRTGMRYATALSLAPGLRAGVVPPDEIEAGRAAIVEILFRFTPGIEPCDTDPGVFHLDASGLARLLGPPDVWAAALRDALLAAGFRSRIAVGFTRFGVRAAAKTVPSDAVRDAVRDGTRESSGDTSHDGDRGAAMRGIVVFASPEEERRAAERTPLARLGIEPSLRDMLGKLGVFTAGEFLALPAEGILRRFGKEALALRRFAEGGPGTPLARTIPPDPLTESVVLEHAESDAERLVFIAKRLLDPLVGRAAARGLAITGVVLGCSLERHPALREELRAAAPTLDAAQIMDLVRLRLASLRLPSAVTEMFLTATGSAASVEQLRLFAERATPGRDLRAAERAFARLRAEFGDDVVVTARLRDGHLPEASFVWEPATRAALPKVRSGAPRFPGIAAVPASGASGASGAVLPLVRRVFTRPLPLSPRPHHEPVSDARNEWLVRGPEDGTVVRLSGPYVVAGGWWAGTPGSEVRREYAFAETSRGHVLWIYSDPRRKRWFLAGRVE